MFIPNSISAQQQENRERFNEYAGGEDTGEEGHVDRRRHETTTFELERVSLAPRLARARGLRRRVGAVLATSAESTSTSPSRSSVCSGSRAQILPAALRVSAALRDRGSVLDASWRRPTGARRSAPDDDSLSPRTRAPTSPGRPSAAARRLRRGGIRVNCPSRANRQRLPDRSRSARRRPLVDEIADLRRPGTSLAPSSSQGQAATLPAFLMTQITSSSSTRPASALAAVGGRMTVGLPVRTSICAMWLPASDA